ncbi:MAG: PQQ-dependent sugar dehydrogenase [Myxococcales bacterium]|nr:PQQ-dependent sugar dehydrogenase [Myxococcales bacterium]
MGPISAAPRARGGLLALVFASSTALLAPACDEAFPRELSAGAVPPPVDVDAGDASSRVEPDMRESRCVAPPRSVGRVRLEPAFGSTKLSVPVDLAFRGGRAYVLELTGALRVVSRATGAVTTAIDLSTTVPGTVGFALHPTKPYVYVAVDTVLREGEPYFGEVRRYTSADGGATFDPASEQIVLHVDRPFNVHGFGTLRFGPDGLLYVGSGEGGRSAPRQVISYDPNLLLGAILRIDVDAAEPYAIPPSNPYAGGGGRGEIFAGGFRNPFRFSHDRATGELWVGDVGEGREEEIDRVELGKNYGWPAIEGTRCHLPADGCDPSAFAAPEFIYERGEGSSVTGGFVYRGDAIPALHGRYVFGDYISGRIWALDEPDASGRRRSELLNADGPFPHILAFAEDEDGELYVSGEAGVVYAVRPPASDPIDNIPRLLSKTGCLDPRDPSKLAVEVTPYDVNMALWSDGLVKTRALSLPKGAAMAVGPDDKLTVPDGAVLLKTFAHAGRRIETRMLMRQAGGNWVAYTYEWNAEQTDAVRVDIGKTLDLPGGQKWQIPGPGQCFLCHTDAAGKSLGLEVGQLNRDVVDATGRATNQLEALRKAGLFVTDRAPSTWPRFPRIDGPEPPAARARAYMHVNCAVCHQPGGGTLRNMDFRITAPSSSLLGCSKPLFEVPGLEGAKLIEPGDPARSVLFARMSTRGGYQMPTVGTFLPDPAATAVLDAWIRGLTDCE